MVWTNNYSRGVIISLDDVYNKAMYLYPALFYWN